MEELKGNIEKFIFQSSDTGFCVFILKSKSESITIRGYFPSLQIGQDVSLSGKWVDHPKFGNQFEAQSCIPIIPTSKFGLKKFLGSGLIKGIGKIYAEKLVDYFGEKVIEVIENEPDRLNEIDGIGVKRVELITSSFQEHRHISRIMIFLQDKGISPAYATKIYKKYKHESIAVVQQNPYRLADEIWGIGFKIADQIAQNLGLSKESIDRIKAGITFAITSEIGNGHLYVEVENLKKKSTELLELNSDNSQELIKRGLHELYSCDKIKIITTPTLIPSENHESQDKHFITLSQYYATEKNVANWIEKLNLTTTKFNFDYDKIYTQLRTQNHIELNEKQQKAILSCLQNKISIVTGGPGTGKTTVIKTLIDILKSNNVSFQLTAPTGRAAKRMQESTFNKAQTIHRLLEFDVSIMKFKINENCTLKVDFLIVDEASMIDIFLANSLLKALPIHAHLVLIGDIDQLPSVGAGNFLKDLINSKKVSCVQLTEIFRQAQNSLIVVNAHRINKGEFPTTFLSDSKKDFIFIKEEDPTKVKEHLENIIKYTLKKNHIEIEHSIVLVPMNKGIVGAHKLNLDLQKMINSDETKKSIQRIGYTFRLGDRVMQIRNNYDKFIFNGDMGTIEDIDIDDKKLFIRFDKKLLEYEHSELDEIVLAYAISVHKSQGSEYDAVIVPIFTQHFTLLQRNLIYTALTRAKKLCIFIGQVKALAIAIKNNKNLDRKTFLKEFLTTDLECRI
jgi:exodeoxyribonuclease V alpha subunit